MQPLDLINEMTRLGIVDEKSAADIASEHSPDMSVAELTQTLAERGVLTAHQAKILTKGDPAALVIGDYVVIDKIGQGGMGAVYRARHRVMHREVAIKVLPPSIADDDQAMQRFLREVRAAGKLLHPNIVTAYDAGHTDDLLYLAMECVDGKDLGAILHETDTPFTPDQTIDYIIQAAQGLSYAHKHGVIHRDIKPGNLLLNHEGVIKILDMGLARIEHEMAGGEYQTLTQTDASMGTAAYMPPEQGMDAKSVDQRGDIYSLGCTMFRLLTNRYPYYRDTPLGTMMAHVQEPIPSLPDDMPAGLDDVFRKMVAKEPDGRYDTCEDLIAALETVKRGGKPAVPDLANIPVARRARHEPTPMPDPTDSDGPPPSQSDLSDSKPGTLTDLANVAASVDAKPPSGAAHAAPRKKSGMTLWVGLAAGVAIIVMPLTIMFMSSGTPKDAHPSPPTVKGGDETIAPDPTRQPGHTGTRQDPHQIPVDTPTPSTTTPTTSPTPPSGFLARAPFDADQAKAYQQDFAKLVGVPVQIESQRDVKLVLIPPGSYPTGMAGHPEWTPRNVTVTRGFYIGVTEVTINQFRQFIVNSKYKTQQLLGQAKAPNGKYWPAAVVGWAHPPNDPDISANAPVTYVTYKDAVAYCEWLSQKEGKRYRLPTEAEWELACRAGSTNRFWFGNDHKQLPETDWVNDNAKGKLQAVSRKTPNPWGVYDVQGNAWEWMTDFKGVRPGGNLVDPKGPDSGEFRVVAGGGFDTNIASPDLGCGRRMAYWPDYANYGLGFRIVMELDSQPVLPAPIVAAPAPIQAPFDISGWTEPVNLGPVINSKEADGGASLSADGLTLYFHSKRPGGSGASDLWTSTRTSVDAPWTTPVNVGPRVNSGGADLAPSVSADGLTLYFSSYRNAGTNGTDLYMCTRKSTDAPWGAAVNLSAINTSDNEAEPSISRDGLTLFFQADHLDPNKRGDLWQSSRPTTDAPWGKPVKLGDAVNTDAPEGAPMLTADGLTLLFKSIRPGGGGRWDVYASHRASVSAPWGEPAALQFLNTAHDDKGPTLSADGRTLIFESDRPGGHGDDDLWMSQRLAPAAPPVATPAPAPALAPIQLLTSNDWEWSAVENLGAGVNTAEDERSPFVTSDGLTLLFSRGEKSTGNAGEILISTRRSLDEPFGAAQNIGPPINSDQHETDAVMSADRRDLVFCRNNKLWLASRQSPTDLWSEPTPLSDAVNGPLYNHPLQLSADGLTLWHTHDEAQQGKIDFRVSTRPSRDKPFGDTKILESGPRRTTNITQWIADDERIRVVGLLIRGITVDARETSTGPWTAHVPVDALFRGADNGAIGNVNLAAQGRVMVLASNRHGGLGKRDLWMFRLVRKGTNSSIVEPARDANADASTIFDGVDFAEIDFNALKLKALPISTVKPSGPRCRPLFSLSQDGSKPLMAVAQSGKGKALAMGTHKLHLADDAFTRGILRWMGVKPGGRVYLGSTRTEQHKIDDLPDIAREYDVQTWTPGQRVQPGEVVLFDTYQTSPRPNDQQIAQLQQDVEAGAGVVIGLPAWAMRDEITADPMSVWYNRFLKAFDMALTPDAVDWNGSPAYVFDESGKPARTLKAAHPLSQ
ncbi:MAG: SUMF1/EgtB/PvdO family nonheme iron enzyme [Phycisphaera sp.]|nr:SUMF1/EgtB/PvdO family nonheme iron enzyme [Phycisphaera sp.]